LRFTRDRSALVSGLWRNSSSSGIFKAPQNETRCAGKTYGIDPVDTPARESFGEAESVPGGASSLVPASQNDSQAPTSQASNCWLESHHSFREVSRQEHGLVRLITRAWSKRSSEPGCYSAYPRSRPDAQFPNAMKHQHHPTHSGYSVLAPCFTAINEANISPLRSRQPITVSLLPRPTAHDLA
jgi:hypothetical protein